MDFGIGEVWLSGAVMTTIKSALKRWKSIKKNHESKIDNETRENITDQK